MKICIPVDIENILDAHFGHCRFLYVATINDGEVESVEKLVPPPHEPGLLPQWLSERNITDILAGGMGQKAMQLFNSKGISVFTGAPKQTADKLVEAFLKGSLSFEANACAH